MCEKYGCTIDTASCLGMLGWFALLSAAESVLAQPQQPRPRRGVAPGGAL